MAGGTKVTAITDCPKSQGKKKEKEEGIHILLRRRKPRRPIDGEDGKYGS